MAKVLKKKNLAEEMRDRSTGNNQSYKVVEEQKTINPGNLLNKIEGNNQQSNFQNRVNQLYQQNMQMTNLARTPLENLPDNVKQQAKWIGNKTGVGVQLGVLGLGSAGLTDVANQLRKGEESSKEETKFNLNNSLLLPNEIANIPGIIKTLKESKENAPKDETITQALARTLQDSVSIATDMLPFKSKTNAVIQTIGNLFKEKTGLKGSDILLKGNEEIRKPTEKYSQRLEEEGQNYNPLVQLMGNAAQSVGNMTPSIAASVVLPGSQIASLGMMGASVKGNSTSEMLKKGEDLQNAIDRGNTDAAIEIGTELLTGGVNIFGKGALDDILNKNIIQKVDNEVARFFVKQGVDIAGENLEETISDILGTILDKGTTDPDAKYTKEEWTETQLTTILTTTALKILTGGLIGDINMANNRNQLRSEVNENTNLNETERENLNRKIRNEDITNSEELQSELKKINEIDTSGLSEDRVKSLYNFAERNNLSLDEVRQLVEADQQRFNLETNTEKSQRIIDESNLSEDEKKSISRFAEKNNLTLQETENLIKDTLDSREIDQKLGELPKEQAQDILREANSKDLSFEDTKKLINEQIEENNVEQEAQRQLGLNLESFEKDGNTYYKEKQNIVINDSDTLESSFEKYYGKNETKTLKSVKNLNNYAKTVGTSIIFDANTPGFKVTAEDVKANPKLKGLEGTIKTNVEACFDTRNGKRVIVLNPYAKTDKTIQRIISHELTHNVLGNDSNEAKQLMKTVEDFWINKYGQKEYNKLVNNLKESYGEAYNDEELTAKTIEQLFTSEESLTDLANSNPNIFTRIYSKLVGMYAKLTGSEKAYVKKMKLDMELAWKNSKNDTNLQDATKYSIDSIDDIFNMSTEKLKNRIQEDEKLNISTQDSQGRKLTKEQQEYFKDSKVRDKNGNLMILHHGTDVDFNTFEHQYIGEDNKDGLGFYFTPNELQFEYDNPKTVYVNITNPATIEDGDLIDRIIRREEELHETIKDKKQILEQIQKEFNVDGIIDKNRNNVVAFNSNQIKNIDNKKPTTNPDIRYSQETDIDNKLNISTQDSQGRQLSEQQQEYFKDSKARDENGNLLTLYHGTPNGNFTVFRSGTYLTANKNYADRYQSTSASSLGNGGKELVNPKTFEVYANIKNPFVLSDSKAKEIYVNEYIKGGNALGISPYEDENFYNEIGVIDWTEGEDLKEWLQENYPEYDSIILDEGGDIGYDGESYVGKLEDRGDSILVFNPEQIKNVDNKKPTSNPDIRYSVETEEFDKRLAESFPEPATHTNNGTALTKKQQSFFKDSKARDLKNGGLVNVYHTTTDRIRQFNEFNPVGTPYYHFGSQVVNYFTDSQEMSGSYAEQEYQKADTQKLKSLQDAENWLTKNTDVKDNFSIKESINEKGETYYHLLQNGREVMLFNDGKQDFLSRFKEGVSTYIHVFKDINKLATEDSGYDKFQYSGYVNIKNPYVINAEGRNWNMVVSESNEFIDELDEEVPQEVKDNLTRLYRKSEDISNDARDEYSKYDRVINDIANPQFSLISGYAEYTKDNDIKNINHLLRRTSLGEVLLIDQGYKNVSTSFWYSLADVLQQGGIIDSSTANTIIDDFTIPEKVKDWIHEQLYKKVNFGLDDVSNIKELYEKRSEAYEKFDKYRYPQNYFIEKVMGDPNDEDFVDLGRELSELLELRAELKGEYEVTEEIAQAASVGFSKPQLIRVWGTSKTTNDIVKQVIKYNNSLFENDYSPFADETPIFNRTPNEILAKGGYDGVIIRNVVDYGGKAENFEPHDLYVTFGSNQFKAQDNKNPTNNLDIRYSKELEDKWTEILTKYDTGKTKTYLPGIPNVLPKANTDYQTEIADKIDSLKIPDDRKVELYGIVEQEWNDNSLKNVLRDLDAIEQDFIREQALQQEQARFEGKAYDEENRKKLILKKKAEFNKSMDYDDSVVAELDNMIPRNRNGRRTVKQWKDMAKQLGERIANLSPEQIEDIAVKSYYDLDPAHSITAYDSRTKTTDNNKRLYANDWVNKVYEGVRENRKYSMETQPIIPEQEQPVLPKQPKVLNPTEIANLTLEDANTTPVLPGKRYQKGSKESSFVSNITSDVGFLTEEQRKDITSDENVRYYAPVTNAESLKNAYEKLQQDGQRATMNWYAKDTQNASAEDVATGWILLKQYADNGDTQSMVNVAKKLRDMGSKAGQTVQAFNIMSRLTPEGMVAYTQSELQDAYDEMIKGKSKKWIDQHKADFDLSPEEVAFIMDTMQNLPAENLETNNYERKVALGQIQKLFTDKLPVERKQDQNLDENLNVIQS